MHHLTLLHYLLFILFYILFCAKRELAVVGNFGSIAAHSSWLCFSSQLTACFGSVMVHGSWLCRCSRLATCRGSRLLALSQLAASPFAVCRRSSSCDDSV
jgi:hypothetical protein